MSEPGTDALAPPGPAPAPAPGTVADAPPSPAPGATVDSVGAGAGAVVVVVVEVVVDVVLDVEESSVLSLPPHAAVNVLSAMTAAIPAVADRRRC